MGKIIPDSNDTLAADVEITDRDVPATALIERIIASPEPDPVWVGKNGLSEACHTDLASCLGNMLNHRSVKKDIRVYVSTTSRECPEPMDPGTASSDR